MKFKGTDSPKIYIIDYKSHPEDLEVGYPMSGQRGQYVCSLLGSMDLLGDVRFACWTEQTPEAVSEDIIKCNPKLIIGFGGELLKELSITERKITDVSGNVFDVLINGVEFKYLAIVSPSYVLRCIDNNDVTLKFSQNLYKAFQIITGEWRDVYKEKEVLSAHSFKEFVDIYESHWLNDHPRISYDIETNARPPLFEGSRIIGFSIGGQDSGVYVSIDSLDFHMSQEEEDKIWNYLINEIFEKKDKLIIHNTMYERPYTLCCKNYEIRYEKADDTLVMARLLRSPKESAGLKYQAQKYLHYPDWETDLGKYISGFRNLVDRVIFGPKKFSGIHDEIRVKKVGIFELEDTESFKSLSNSDKEELSQTVYMIKSTCLGLYSDEEIIELGRLITEKLNIVEDQGGILDSTIPYNWIPDKVLSKYGALDSISTFELCDYFESKMDEESTDKVDLHKGYKNWLEHMYVAYIMERNGINWNEDLVKEDEKFLTNQANTCIKSMLKSELFKPFILRCCEYRYKPIILSDFLPQIPDSQGFRVEYDHDTDKYKVFFNGKHCAKGRIDDIKIPDNLKDEYTSIVHEMFNDEINKMSHFEELKEIFNPASPASSGIIRKILVTKTLQMGGIINNLHTLAISPEFEPCINDLNQIDKKFIEISNLLVSPKILKENYGDNWWIQRKQLYEGFLNLYNNYRFKVISPEIREVLSNNTPISVESFDDESVIEVYNSYVVTGIDQDNPDSWTEEFKWMMNYRLYKKSQKLISSYINGSVGRQSVVVVDKNDEFEGKDRVVRKRGFDNYISNDESYLMAAKWSPNTAETGRWRSAIHTIPWGSQVKKYYTSRFKGGIMVCPDYSQMEVRTLAAISRDENMLELFHSGKDFHSQTAASVWQKPVEEVTPAERRFSKTATFSLLYGAMEESFANNYCNGDMAMAEKIYGGFFRAYPKVQEWVEERHEEVQRDHRVSLELSNRFIQINPSGEGKGALNSMLRKSQNYPIQAQSADLTGCVIYDIQMYIEEHNMKSKIVMYVHDSIEIDIYPYEMIQLLDTLKFILNDSPMKRMGLPSKADVTLGKSLGHEIDMKSIEYNEDYTDAVIVLEGFKDEVYETIDVWKSIYKTVEVLEEDWEDKFISMGELFIVKKAYSPTVGTMRQEGTCKVHINYFN